MPLEIPRMPYNQSLGPFPYLGTKHQQRLCKLILGPFLSKTQYNTYFKILFYLVLPGFDLFPQPSGNPGRPQRVPVFQAVRLQRPALPR